MVRHLSGSARETGSRAPLTLSIIALFPLLIACPLPIAHTDTISVPIVGLVTRVDGTPVSGAEVTVSPELEPVTGCDNSSIRARTDTAGVFRLSGIEQHHSVTLIVPNLDLAVPRNVVCIAVHDTLRRAYSRTGSVYGPIAPDTVSCIVWELQATPRVSCTGRVSAGVVAGGRWSEGGRAGGSGFYRVLLADEPTPADSARANRPRSQPYAYLQWMESRAPGPGAGYAPPYRVRAMVSLPFDREKMLSIESAQLWRREGRWMASLIGHGPGSFFGGNARRELIFQLGAPGEATLVAGQ